MNDIQTINFEDLTRRYCQSHGVPDATHLLDTAIGGEGEAELAYLLRDHRKEDIEKQREVDLRDAFDYLLAFYGLMEIASLIRFVPQTLPAAFRERALAHLRQPSVRRYYEDFYPVALPTQFRRRLEGEHDIHIEPSQEVAAIFIQFLELNRIVEDDADVDAFLWFLDSGWYGDYSIKDMVASLRNPEVFRKSIQTPPGKQNAVHRSLHGFLKFVNFCRDFDNLLKESADYPSLQSAMWEHHAYWFRQLREDLDNVLDEAFEHFRGWMAPATESDSRLVEVAADANAPAPAASDVYFNAKALDLDEQREPGTDTSETRESINRMQRAVRRLTSDDYRVNSLGEAPGATSTGVSTEKDVQAYDVSS